MARLTPQFSADRTVREYTEEHYLAAAGAYRARAADKGSAARKVVDRQNALAAKWPALRFGALTVESKAGQNVITVEAFLHDLNPDFVRVELYADGANGGGAALQEMTRVRESSGGEGGYVYSGTVPSTRPASDYTARIMPNRDILAVPLEAGWILWQK
jgi:starch phosphorylase